MSRNPFRSEAPKLRSSIPTPIGRRSLASQLMTKSGSSPQPPQEKGGGGGGRPRTIRFSKTTRKKPKKHPPDTAARLDELWRQRHRMFHRDYPRRDTNDDIPRVLERPATAEAAAVSAAAQALSLNAVNPNKIKRADQGLIHQRFGVSIGGPIKRLLGFQPKKRPGILKKSKKKKNQSGHGRRKTRRKKHRKKRKTKRVNLENVRKRLRKAILSYEKKERAKGRADLVGDGLQAQRWWLQATPSQRKDFCIFFCRKENKKLPVCKHHCSPLNVFGRHKTRKKRSKK